MADRLNYQEIAWAERRVDCYDGPNCDQHRALWRAHFDGDMDSEDMYRDLPLDPKQFPAGTKVVIMVPVCPNCDQQVEMCEQDKGCDFDWKAWAEGQYS